MKFELQELKIPAGWFISLNQFYAVSPSEETVESADTVFTEDILQFKNEYRNRLIDLGWYPKATTIRRKLTHFHRSTGVSLL